MYVQGIFIKHGMFGIIRFKTGSNLATALSDSDSEDAFADEIASCMSKASELTPYDLEDPGTH
jgi:hypothetical protein